MSDNKQLNLTNEVHIKTYQGFTSAEIAKDLNISQRTVQRHLKSPSPIVKPDHIWFKVASWVIENDYEEPCKLICYIEEGKKKAEVRSKADWYYWVMEPEPNSSTWESLIEDLMEIDFPEHVDYYNNEYQSDKLAWSAAV